MKRKTWVLAGAAVLVAVTATGGGVVVSGAKQAAPAAQEPPANTAKVEKGKLSAMVSMDGTLTYRARSDGSPYSVINQARGTYTKLPDDGDKVDCGDVLYRVDDHPVLLLCGTVPAYRDLHTGDVGKDVRQLNRNLTSSATTPRPVSISIPTTTLSPEKTERALQVLQHDKGWTEERLRRDRIRLELTAQVRMDDAVFLPESVRIAKVTGELGGSAQPGAQVLYATSDTLEVQVDLEASQQGEVKEGDPAQITLPGNKSVTGKVDRLGRVAQVPAGQNTNARRQQSGPRPSRPTSVSTTRKRHAGSTRPRSRWTSRPGEWRAP